MANISFDKGNDALVRLLSKYLPDDYAANPQPKTDVETEVLALSQNAYQTSTTYLEYEKMKWIKNYNLYNSIHDMSGKYYDTNYTHGNTNRSNFFIPKTLEFVKNQVAGAIECFFNQPEFVNFSPVDDLNEQSCVAADYYTGLINYRLDCKPISWFDFIHDSFQTATMHNFVVGKVYWDWKINAPRLDSIAIENFRVDPKADASYPIETSPYLIQVMRMYVGDIKARAKSKDEKIKWNELDDSVYKQYLDTFQNTVEIARYVETKLPLQNQSSNLEYQQVNVHENIVKLDGEDYLFYTLGTDTLLSKVYKLKDVYLQGRPYVIGHTYKEEHKVYPTSTLQQLYPLQVAYNSMFNLGFDAKHYVLFPRLFVDEKSHFDAYAFRNSRPETIIQVKNPKDSVQQLQVTDMSKNILQDQNTILSHIDEVGGMFSTSSLQQNDNGMNSVGGQQNIMSKSSQLFQLYIRTFTSTYVEPILKLLVKVEQLYSFDDTDTIQKIFNKQKIAEKYLTDDDGNPKTKKFTINKEFVEADLSLVVNVGLNVQTPQMKLQMETAAVNSILNVLEKGQGILNSEEWIKHFMYLLGYRNVDKFFKKGVDPQMLQMQQQMQAMQQKLDAKMSPEMEQAQIQKIAAEIQRIAAQTQGEQAKTVQTNVQSQYEAMQLGEVVAAVGEAVEPGDVALSQAGFKGAQGGTADFSQFQNQPQATNALPSQVQMNGANPNPLLAQGQMNTHPMFPPQPASGNKGLTGGNK